MKSANPPSLALRAGPHWPRAPFAGSDPFAMQLASRARAARPAGFLFALVFSSCGDSPAVLDPAATPAVAWHLELGGEGSESASALAVAPSGETLVAGTFAGTVDFGGGPLTARTSHDLFLARYDANGHHRFSRALNGAQADLPILRAIDDGTGGWYLAGAHYGEALDLGGGAVPNAGRHDGFVARLDSAGAPIFTRIFGDAADQLITAAARAADGGLWVAGRFEGRIQADDLILDSAGTSDAFLLHMDREGRFTFAQRYGDAAPQSAGALAVANDGTVALAGVFQSTIDLGGGPLVSAGDFDLFLAWFDPFGGHLQSARFGGTRGEQEFSSLAFDADGRLHAGGSYRDVLQLGDVRLQSRGQTDVFLARFERDGSVARATSYGDSELDVLRAIAVSPNDLLWATGTFRGAFPLGGISSAIDGTDLFIAAFDAADEPVLSRGFGAPGSDQVAATLGVDDSGAAYLWGAFERELDLGDGARLSAGGRDVFLAKFHPKP